MYYELVITILLKDNIHLENSYEFLSTFLNKGMLQDEKLKELHQENKFKFYSYSNLQPLERDKIYKEGRIYYFNLRSIDISFLGRMKRAITYKNPYCKVISSEIKTCKPKYISKIVSLSPAVSTIDSGRYWVKEDGLDLIMSRICSNGNKKYESYYGKEVDKNHIFVESIVQLNNFAIKIPYKNTFLLGNKFEIGIKSDELSQAIAKIVLGTNLLEKGSIGCGYCLYK
ncbi:CRISPR-associated endoribonuclease Cas6 [Alkalibaculum bacchi]|uniref:CRISPR-associated endoribonuclease Cas6 n=1 Tax=Alkalibaculum bacchi TaxID=645887 RepID=UPI0026EB43C5|nr:CRISPR-associated endoribonuclease Cas6 [Alkalibaculum bacchi]